MDSPTSPQRTPDNLWKPAKYSGGPSTPVRRDESASEDSVPVSFGGPQYASDVNSVSARRYGVIFLGLPGRGKTFLAHKLCVLFGWLGHNAKVFNVQRLWRDLLNGGGANRSHSRLASFSESETEHFVDSRMDFYRDPESKGTGSPPTHARFNSPRYDAFDFDLHPENRVLYTEALKQCRLRVSQFFEDGGLVAFINDDFCAADLREEAESMLKPLCDEILYIEVIRHDNSTFDSLKIKSGSEGYLNLPDADALRDFHGRVDVMRRSYISVGEGKRYIKVIDGRKLEIQGVSGYLPSRMVSFLMNLSQKKVSYPIYFSRHGQTTYNIEDRIGGNPNLTEKGQLDALCLKEFIGEIRRELQEAAAAKGVAPPELQIWTSQLTRTIQTAKPAEEAFTLKCLRWSSLNEIHAGVCEDLTYADVKVKYPFISEFRKQNKYSFRYPGGESYQDLVARLEPVIMELENANCVVVVVAHQAILRGLLAYFGESSAQSSVDFDVPHRTVWRCTSTTNGTSNLEELHLNDWLQARGITPPESPTTPLKEAGAGAAPSPPMPRDPISRLGEATVVLGRDRHPTIPS